MFSIDLAFDPGVLFTIVFSGGTGTPKLLLGLKEILSPEDLTVVVNTAEDLWISGNLVSPDLDTVLYTLAGLVDMDRWWGILGDTFLTSGFLAILGQRELLALGDKDRAVHIFRSELIRAGLTLTEATFELSKALGIKESVLPMTDDHVSTLVTIPEGEVSFQEFWVGRRGEPEILSLRLKGIEEARPSPALLDALTREEVVLLGPSNPVTSLGPILALKGVRELLSGKKVVAISPFYGNKPFSGPAAKFMRAMGVPANDCGVSSLLGPLDRFLVSNESSYSGECVRLDTLMRSKDDSLRLAKKVLELISCL